MQTKKTGEVEGAAMDEVEFHRILALFPVVRSRDYHAESESSRQSTSQTRQNAEVKESQDAWIVSDKKGINIQDAFWEKLRLAATKKVGASEAEGFVKAFQHVYNKLSSATEKNKGAKPRISRNGSFKHMSHSTCSSASLIETVQSDLAIKQAATWLAEA